jgi:hypothetical protein
MYDELHNVWSKSSRMQLIIFFYTHATHVMWNADPYERIWACELRICHVPCLMYSCIQAMPGNQAVQKASPIPATEYIALYKHIHIHTPETVFLNFLWAQEKLIPMNWFCQPLYPGGPIRQPYSYSVPKKNSDTALFKPHCYSYKFYLIQYITVMCIFLMILLNDRHQNNDKVPLTMHWLE